MKSQITFHDQTSNQLLVDAALGHKRNAELLHQTAVELKDQGWLAIYTRMAVRLCKKNIDAISGRVLLQTLPSKAYDTEATIAHARLYDAEFRAHGISRDRFCIKIPSTGPALLAAKTLRAEGIATLGTAVFGIPQAVACSQSNCLYISPYYNEIDSFDDKSLWPDVADPALQHPFSARLVQMIDLYRRLFRETGKEQPLIKNAAYLSVPEALATAEIGCHSATIPHTVLSQLAAQPYDAATAAKTHAPHGLPKPAQPALAYHDSSRRLPARLQPLLTVDPLGPGGKLPYDPTTVTATDYLANGGAVLDAAIAADPEAARRLKAALDKFIGGENSSKATVEKVLASL